MPSKHSVFAFEVGWDQWLCKTGQRRWVFLPPAAKGMPLGSLTVST